MRISQVVLRAAMQAVIYVFIALAAIVLIFVQEQPLLHGQTVAFAAPDGQQLSAWYHRGSKPAGVLLLEGFGSDQVTMRSAAYEFSRLGLQVMTFDFSGHGRSTGNLGFDNAQTDRLARETLAAREYFKQLSGLNDSQILFFGHSLGARTALQAAVLADVPPAGLVLMGTQVNLGRNAQSEFFTGTGDTVLDWVQALSPTRPAAPILLISGSWDDILTPQAAQLLFCKLGGSGCVEKTVLGSLARRDLRELRMLPALVHNYEVYSPRALGLARNWTAELLGVPAVGDDSFNKIWYWLCGMVGMVGAAFSGLNWVRLVLPDPGGSRGGLTLQSPRGFFTGKLMLWLPAIPLAALLGGAVFLLPLGIPVMNLIYVGFIGAYGLLQTVLFRLGRMPGIIGRLPFESGKSQPVSTQRWLAAAVVTLLFFGMTAAYARTGWFYVYAPNQRLIWLVLFSLPTSVGFWLGLQESRLLERDAPDRPEFRRWHMLVGLVPFFFYALLLGGLGSISGLLGSFQGLVILAVVLAYGPVLQRLTGRAWLAALMQSLLLYWLVLPTGVLFR